VQFGKKSSFDNAARPRPRVRLAWYVMLTIASVLAACGERRAPSAPAHAART